jgi:hypothetical protein
MKGYCRFWIYILIVAWIITGIIPNSALAQISKLDLWGINVNRVNMPLKILEINLNNRKYWNSGAD